MKRLFCILIIALTSSLAYAQQPGQIELPCPAGYSPTYLGQAYDQATGKYRQWQCVNNNGIVTTNLTDAGGQVFNVKAYGAKGDGTTDDSADIQAAYAAAVSAGGGIVFFPQTSSCYLIDNPINATSDGHNIIFTGAGGPGYSNTGSANALLCGNTGGSVFDITMGFNRTFLDLDISAQKSGLSNPSSIAILAGRNSIGQSGQNTHIINCSFMMPLHFSGTTYSFGLYFFGEEIAFTTNTKIEADYPIVATSHNNFSISSPYITFGTSTYSETDLSFNDMEIYTSGLGPAVYLYGASDVRLSGHSYNGSQANPYPAGLYNYAFEEHDCHDLNVSAWRQEGYPGYIYVDGGLYSSIIQGTNGPAPSPPTHAVEFNGGASNVNNVDFKIYDEMSSSANWYYDGTEGSPVGIWTIDDVSFYCGNEINCVNIPLGQGAGIGTSYWKRISWSGTDSNNTPKINLSKDATALPVTGVFTIPTTLVAATSCTQLPFVSSSGEPALAYVEVHPQVWYGLIVTAAFGTGGIIPTLCNPTSVAITPGSSIGATFKIVQ